MKWTEVPAGGINAANQRLWVALGDKADEVAARINTDPAFVENIARLMVNGGYKPSISQKLAREIMGAKNMFGIDDAIKHFGVNATKQQLAYLTEVPFSEATLEECKDTHVLVAVFPLSILDIRGHVRKLVQTLFCNQDYYNEEAFAKDKGEVGWQLVRKEPIANSTSKTWNDQQALLSKDEETPTARIVVYTMVGHFLATGERLFEAINVRCVDTHQDGYRVQVGYFNAHGLNVNGRLDGYFRDSIGLSAARKSD
jgi:hypothetical protein